MVKSNLAEMCTSARRNLVAWLEFLHMRKGGTHRLACTARVALVRPDEAIRHGLGTRGGRRHRMERCAEQMRQGIILLDTLK
jgi:hypothetical protein